jgi:putative ATP-dependent endonuclease of the OLD family
MHYVVNWENSNMNNSDISIKIKNYRCFRDEFAGFDKIMPVNIIIGRNNSGKSALLDILEFAPGIGTEMPADVVLRIEDVLQKQELMSVFPSNQTGGGDWGHHGQLLLGIKAIYEVSNKRFTLQGFANDELFKMGLAQDAMINKAVRAREQRLREGIKGNRVPEFFRDKVIQRLAAERDIVPERPQLGETYLNLSHNGVGATNIIYNYLNDSDFDRNIIKKGLESELNKIMHPDGVFGEIVVRVDRKKDQKWEVYLSEDKKGLIPLSESGSGLKTIILVLLNLLIMPRLKKKTNRVAAVKDHLFLFEELENNMHPTLLRRLFQYIENFAIANGCHFFITTHSSVVIDQFSRSPNAQIIHITHDGRQATTKTVASFGGQAAILDDIGAKASDLLQANGIIWLEGPSDKIYFNKWVEIYSGGTLQEHRDYECAFYGGSVLKHFTADEPAGDSDAINVLRVNRNSVLIGDSDKTAADSPLKDRLQKMNEAMQAMGAHIWITEAKEIENYIPASAIEKRFAVTVLPDVGQYEQFHRETNKDANGANMPSDYWHKHSLPGTFDKVALARDIIPHLSKDTLANRFDLEKQMGEICDLIRKWNR